MSVDTLDFIEYFDKGTSDAKRKSQEDQSAEQDVSTSGGKWSSMQIPLPNLDGNISSPVCNKESASTMESEGSKDVLRTGTLWTAVAHIITSLIGAGVLSLAWSVAQLGWIAGPVTMVVFALVTFYSTFLIADCYRFPDPITGPERNSCYRDAVRANFGAKRAWICGLIQYTSFFGMCVAYTITTSGSIRAIRRSNCYHKNGHASAACHFPDLIYIILFGVTQIMLCQIPNFHKLWGLSILAATMSFTYATIGFGLGMSKVIGNGEIKGNLGGISANNSLPKTQKVCRMLQGLADISFAFQYTYLALEIQDTLKSTPPETVTMKKANFLSLSITTTFYMLCAFLGYAAFGEKTPGNLLTGFGFYEPYWLVDVGNACIVVHLVAAYQVYCQPIFACIEGWFSHTWPDNKFIKEGIPIGIPLWGSCRVNLLRLCWRTAFVMSTTGIAILFPLFNDVLGILGALSFWPLVVYFPVEMHIAQNKLPRWTLKWNIFQIFSLISLLVTLISAAGSIEGLLKDKDT
eukprot:PITA_23099